MNWQEFIETNQRIIVGKNRSWNNSMYIYEDALTIWNFITCKPERVNLPADFFDTFSLEIDKRTQAYLEYQRFANRELRKIRKNNLRLYLEWYGHHGILTAAKLGTWLSKLDNKDTRTKLEKLLSIKNFKNAFRKSLCEQILNWVRMPRKARKYEFPLSRKQLSYLW